MQISISARKVNLKNNFKDRVEKKLKKFDKIFSDSARATVTVTVNKNSQTVEVTINDGGMIYRAESTCEQMNDALDKVVYVLGRQIRKNKSKLNKRMKSERLEDFLSDEYRNSDDKDDTADTNEYDVVRVKNFIVNSMDTEEAILQMNMLSHNFFIFRDVVSGEMRVVYRRKGDTYGVISPIEPR